MSGKWLNNVARLIKNPATDGYFLKFERPTKKDGTRIGEDPFPLIINEGDTFSAKLKKDDLKGLVANGRISQEQANEICETVKFEFSRPPQDGSAPKSAAPKKSTKSDEEIPF